MGGTKRVITPYDIVVDGDMSSTITGESTNILYTDRVSYQIKYTGTPTGTFSVQVSNDEETWEDLTLSVSVTATGSADNHFIDCETGASFIRLVYTASSGAGTLQAILVAKSISA